MVEKRPFRAPRRMRNEKDINREMSTKESGLSSFLKIAGLTLAAAESDVSGADGLLLLLQLLHRSQRRVTGRHLLNRLVLKGQKG